MKQSRSAPPSIYAIWVEARPDGPLRGRSGFLSEDGYRLFFTSDTEMDQKIRDLRSLCLNRTPAVTYHGVAYPGDHDISASISTEQIKACGLRPDFDPTRYEIAQRIYGNTGGGCMVGTLAVRYPELDKTLWIHCNDEGVSVSSADYVWNEDRSGSWARYEDVSLLELDFWEHSPKDAGALFPAIQDAVTYTIQQAVQNSDRPFRIPAKWLPEAFCQTTDLEYVKWAVEVEHAVEVGKEGVIINDPKYLFRNAPQAITPGTIAYIASPLSGNIDENLQFARKACGYAAMQGAVPYAPHLLFPQFLDDNDPEQRDTGIRMGLQMLRRCDELWLCGDVISNGMAEEEKLARRLGIPVRTVSSQEILSAEHIPEERMEMSMG